MNINAISDSLLRTVRLFADGSSLEVSRHDIGYIKTILNSDSLKLHEWPKQWLVSFCPNKTDVKFFSLEND